MHKKGISLNSVEKSLSHSADKIRRRILLCFERILVSKSFKRRRGKFFLSHRTEKLRQRTILCFRKILVGKKFLWIGGGGYHDIPSKFLSQCTEKFHWRTLWCFRKFFLSKIFMHRRGGASWFCQKLLSHRTETKNFVKESFCFREVFWYRKKFMHKRGHTTIFYRKLVVSQNRKTS